MVVDRVELIKNKALRKRLIRLSLEQRIDRMLGESEWISFIDKEYERTKIHEIYSDQW